jgi:hypothetical protein
VFDLMLQCWASTAEARCQAQNIIDEVNVMLQSTELHVSTPQPTEVYLLMSLFFTSAIFRSRILVNSSYGIASQRALSKKLMMTNVVCADFFLLKSFTLTASGGDGARHSSHYAEDKSDLEQVCTSFKLLVPESPWCCRG